MKIVARVFSAPCTGSARAEQLSGPFCDYYDKQAILAGKADHCVVDDRPSR